MQVNGRGLVKLMENDYVPKRSPYSVHYTVGNQNHVRIIAICIKSLKLLKTLLIHMIK